MALNLQANTAVDVLIGPFVDSGDGDTEETGLTLSQADIKLSKNGQALAQKNDVTAAAHDANGYYNCELDATDTNTEGQLVLIVHESGALPVRHEFNVLSEAAWDSLYAAKDDGFMDVNIKTVGRADTQETEANNLESACAAYSATRGLSGTALPAAAADAAGGLPISDAGGLDMDAMSGITLAGTASAGSATSITLTGGVATDGYYAGQIVKINSGTGIAQARTILSYVGSTTVATVTRDWAVAPSNDSVFSVHAADLPAILEAGTAQAGASGSITLDTNASAVNATYTGNFVMVTAGTGVGQTRIISGYVGSTKVASVTPNWTTTPDSTSVYQLIPMGRVDLGRIQSVTSAVTNLKSACDNYSATRGLTGTALPAVAGGSDGGVPLVGSQIPNANADAAGGLPISDVGGLDMDAIGTDTARLTAARAGALTDWIDGERLDLLLDAVKAVTDALTASAAAKLALSAGTIVSGAAEAGTLSTTQMSTDLSEATNDHYNGRIIIWTSGVLQNQATDITDYVGTNGVLTFTAVTEAPSATDTFIIV